MSLYEALKQHDLRDLLRQRGVELNAQDYTFAPWREERTPSVKIYRDHFFDYGDEEKRGDLVNWLEFTEFDPAEARREAEQIIGMSVAPEPVRRPQKPTEQKTKVIWLADLVTQAHEALKRRESIEAEAAWAYLTARGLETLVETYHLGVVDTSVQVPAAGKMMHRFQGRVIFPTLEQGRGVWFKARDVSNLTDEMRKMQGRAKYDGPPGRVPAPFNPEGLTTAADLGYMVLTEGETDALTLLALYGSGYPVLGLPGGRLPAGWAEKLVDAGVSDVYTLMDPDAAGDKHTGALFQQLSEVGLKPWVLSLPENHDVNSYFIVNGGEALRQWLETATEEVQLDATSDLRYVRDVWPAELDARAERPHTLYPTALSVLDSLLEGGYSEGLHLLGGITGGGKTSYALHLAFENALAGRGIIYASYEQSKLELWARLASGVTGVPYRALKRGYFEDVDGRHPSSRALRASEGWETLLKLAKYLRIVEGGDALSRQQNSFTVDSLQQAARALAERQGAPPLVIIDYLQRVPVPAELRIKDIRERVSFVAGQLQVGLAREVGCPVLALSSISRASYRLAEANLEERLAAFKEAGELEYTAYTALLLYGLPDDVESELTFSPGRLAQFVPRTLDLCKNREGEVGRVAVKWEPKRGRWFDSTAYPKRFRD